MADTGRLLHDFFDNADSGFFAEIGLRNPTAGSKTWTLEQAGWTGVLVEPQPDVAAFLITARSAKVFAVACVAADEAGEPMPLRIESPLTAIDVGRPSSVEPSSYVIMAPTRTLDDILGEAEAPSPVDLLVLDVYGRELDALLGFDFGRRKPRLIVIADPAADLDRHRFLMASGYRLIRRAAGCGWYVPLDSSAMSRSAFVTLLLDYYLAIPFRKAWRALRRFAATIRATAK